MAKVQTEIERRFLLRNRPQLNWNMIYDITQYYININGVIHRLRITSERGSCDPTYEFLHKEFVSKGHFKEHIVDLDPKDIPDLIHAAHKALDKSRFVYLANGLKYEVDEPKGINLTLLEVELHSINAVIAFPKEISNVMIADVTGINELSNYNLAIPIYRTSAEWQATHPSPKVIDPDGWDRQNYDYSWGKEEITFHEYQQRMMFSTCIKFIFNSHKPETQES